MIIPRMLNNYLQITIERQKISYLQNYPNREMPIIDRFNQYYVTIFDFFFEGM